MGDQPGDQSDKVALTRRQALAALGAGVVTLGATNLGTAYAAGEWGKEQDKQELADLQAEVEKLRGLVQLYESLDKIGIDAVITTAMSALKGFLDTLKNGVGLLRAAETTVEGLLGSFRNTFAVIRAGLNAAEQAVGSISGLLKNAETWLGQTTAPAQPLLTQVQQFFHDLIGKIPFGVGDNILKTVDGIVGLVAAIPDAILQVNTRLLEPLQTGWFSDDSAKNLQGSLIDPITHQLLDPLKKFLGDVDQTLAHWQTDMSSPVQTALDSRSVVRKEISDYKKQHNMS